MKHGITILTILAISQAACDQPSEQLVLSDLRTGDEVLIDTSGERVLVTNLQSGESMRLPSSVRLPATDEDFTEALEKTGVGLDEVFEADYSILETAETVQGVDDLADSPSGVAASCSGYGCDGKDPVAYGCDGGWAITVDSESHGIWPFSFNVDQRYGRICQTRWSRFTAPINWGSTVTVYRDSPNATESWVHNGTLNYSDMLYCPRDQCWGKASASVPGEYIETNWIKYF